MRSPRRQANIHCNNTIHIVWTKVANGANCWLTLRSDLSNDGDQTIRLILRHFSINTALNQIFSLSVCRKKTSQAWRKPVWIGVKGTFPFFRLGQTHLSKVLSTSPEAGMLTVCPHSSRRHRNSKLALASQQDSFHVDKGSCQIAGEVRMYGSEVRRQCWSKFLKASCLLCCANLNGNPLWYRFKAKRLPHSLVQVWDSLLYLYLVT